MTNDRASRERLPSGLRFFDPVALIATFGGAGLLPRAPGTWGSLAALLPAWLIASSLGPIALLAGAVVIAVVGAWAADRFATASGFSDPSPVVIDEVVGQWLVLCIAPLDPLWYFAGFALFRVADILKPWPANLADRAVKGGWGIVLDDVIAALYAAAILYALIRIFGGADVFA